jgi:hypothetical protein
MLTARILPLGFIASLWLVEVSAGPCKPSLSSSEIHSTVSTESGSATASVTVTVTVGSSATETAAI